MDNSDLRGDLPTEIAAREYSGDQSRGWLIDRIKQTVLWTVPWNEGGSEIHVGGNK